MAAPKSKRPEPPSNQDVTWVPVHRVVFPKDDDPTVMPLYVDWRRTVVPAPSGPAAAKAGKALQVGASGPVAYEQVKADFSRHAITVPADRRLSLATYFNAFPAAYWQQWTKATAVRLRMHLSAPARVDVYRSTARGSFNRIDGAAHAEGLVEFDLPLRTFGDGGWLWFSVEAAGSSVVLSDATWLAKTFDGYSPRTVSVAITTFNRAEDCVAQMRRFADSPELLARLDQLMITDQGTQSVEAADGFTEAAAALGDQFRLITQGNLGGSGGFARGMLEGVARPGTDYVMLLDDDVIVETEGILRAVNFADFTRKPMIVGGHMLSLYDRTLLLNFGEQVDRYWFTYEAASSDATNVDFSRTSLRQSPALHRRIDVDYNAWWMCLIPRQIIEEIGLSLPVFIKWDDAEYGLRATANGYNTVTLPGAAVWHMPWTEKDDSIDWQAYFHQRNRWLAAMLYSPYRHGGGLPQVSFAIDVRHLLSMQYSAVELRLQSLEDLLRGPSHLHEDLPTINARVRATRREFTDAQVISDVADFPDVRRTRLPARGRSASAPASLPAVYLRAAESALRSFRRVSSDAEQNPQARIAAQDAKWWRLAVEDSALVSTSDGSGASVYVRDRARFFTMLRRSLRLHIRLYTSWNRLSDEYKAALTEYTSPDAWRRTFGRSGGKP